MSHVSYAFPAARNHVVLEAITLNTCVADQINRNKIVNEHLHIKPHFLWTFQYFFYIIASNNRNVFTCEAFIDHKMFSNTS